MKIANTLILIAACACSASARAQKDLETHTAAAPAASSCPAAEDMEQQHLQGLWRAELASAGGGALLRLGPHPELAGSVRGTVARGDTTALVTGDVHEGALALEESTDGIHIAATWSGNVVAGSCGKEIHGTWNNVTPETTLPFVLHKQAAGN
ncbi:hypothetical protein B2J88_31785 [Rhodococcus sp. SRB_17]|nr:hypothetical protein [Rhodococcus sp. SRB_17]